MTCHMSGFDFNCFFKTHSSFTRDKYCRRVMGEGQNLPCRSSLGYTAIGPEQQADGFFNSQFSNISHLLLFLLDFFRAFLMKTLLCSHFEL